MLDLTPFLRTYARRRIAQLGSLDPVKTQEAQLLSLLNNAKNTEFGKDHHFNKITDVATYQKNVPLRTYEKFWNEYWKDNFPILNNVTWKGTIPYFPVSSGTSSGVTKYIPCSHEMIRSNNKAGLDLLVHHLNHKPKSKIFGGKSFMLGGSTDLTEQAKGIFSGDLSGISVKALPWWARLRYFPPTELALIKNWEEKIDILGKESLKNNIRMLSGVPSWLLIFLEKLGQSINKPSALIKDLYPELEMLTHGGVNFTPYYERFKKLLEGSNAELREVYPASEGFIAVADLNYGEGLRLNLDNQIFFEFIPLDELLTPNPTRHWIKNIELDVNYAIVLTTCAGLWSYVIGDTVRFISKTPPRVLVTGRTSYYLSAFGEHLIDEEIQDAISTAANSISASIEDYSVGAIYPEKDGELGGHLYVIEFHNQTPTENDQTIFIEKLDKKLCQRNEDYEAHRADGFGLNPPKLLIAKHGAFARWMKKRGKLGGQNKVPRIITDQKLFNDLISFIKSD